ncbi:MAG TPA: TetR/AcrR family transcriptional regulator [Firmicutes bacterium]|nr:TetR/AcrR family transcriptional regulator [Bacillota bacterium]
MARRTGEKYRAILEAAVKTFARFGFHGTRVADIAREAGVADGTVYIYFRCKEDILISLFQELMDKFVGDLQAELQQCSGAQAKLQTLIDYHFRVLNSRPEQAMVTQIELRQIDREINRGISLPLRKYFRLIEEVIKEGQNAGLFRQNIDIRTARKIIFGAIDEVVTCWVMSTRRYDLASYSRPVFDLLLKGLQ